MILELATVDIKPGTNAAFEQQLAQAQQVITKAVGYISHEFHQCMEIESRYIFLIQWETLEAHTVGFRTSELFVAWRGHIGQYFENPPLVQHYELKMKS